MRRAACILIVTISSALFVACQRRTEFVAPTEASYAVAAAKTYLKTNGIIEQPILQAAGLQDGVWRLELVSAKSKKSDLDCWIIRVSADGKIVTTYGPH
jgi:hypothetical protein